MVFKNMVLRNICDSKREDVSWEWRKLYNEELNDLYPSPIIIWVIERRRMILAVNVAFMRQRKFT